MATLSLDAHISTVVSRGGAETRHAWLGAASVYDCFYTGLSTLFTARGEGQTEKGETEGKSQSCIARLGTLIFRTLGPR